MNILAIDPALSCGWAWTNGVTSERGVWNLRAKPGESQDEPLRRLENLLYDFIETHAVELIALEGASFGSNNRATAAMHNEHQAIVKLVRLKNEIDLKIVNIMSIKSFATGNGFAKKHEMIRAAKIKLGVDVTNHDEADALWILAFAKAGFPQLTATKAKRRGAKPVKEARLF